MRKCRECGLIARWVGIEDRLCFSCGRKGSRSPSWGRKHSAATKEKIRCTKLAELNPNWVGDKVKYEALHLWIKRRFPKPKVCMSCWRESPRDLANKGIYNRDLENWEWLCRRCHMIKDGRLEGFVNSYDRSDPIILAKRVAAFKAGKHTPWNKGKPGAQKASKETRKKMSESQKRRFARERQLIV